ncbi:hypothetical protein F5Y01DRAFT_51451 [Xylaria sp. FL0043]|nr:hypothetical protein F5Y01DRAFT_51451 [Xylaria sp. FL0043]
MSTPSRSNLPPAFSADAIAKKLEDVQRERELETPELDCFADIENDYKYECEQHHKLLGLEKVDRLRTRITDMSYHKHEVELYCQIYAQLVFNRLAKKHQTHGELTLDGLRGMKTSCRRLLAANGLTGESLRATRLDIQDQEYWKPEAELLQHLDALDEHKAMMKFAKAYAKEKAKAKRNTARAREKQPGDGDIRRSSRVTRRPASVMQTPPEKSESRHKEKATGRISGRVLKRKPANRGTTSN